MSGSKILAICQSGGEFVTNSDGSLSYIGGEAHAVEIDREMILCDLLSEIRDMFDWDCDTSTLSIKYFLPGNRRTLITVSNDKDLQRMVDFNADLITTDVYVIKKTESRETVVVDVDPLTIATDAVIPIERESKRQKISDAWENIITGVGQVFEDVKDFRDALHKYAVAKGFTYKFIKNDGTRATAACSAEGCTWRIHASESSADQQFVVKKINDTHTCNGEIGKHGHRLANQRWVAGVIKEKLQDCPDYSPREIMNDFKREYGINLNYAQAWRGRSIAKKELQDSDEEDPSQLFWFCQRITETNPGSVVLLDTREDSTFHRLFICFHASLHGFEQGCRPLLFLGSTSLKVSKQWKLLVATAIDGDNDIFPIAFAVVEDETGENWNWFLGQLKAVLSISCSITFVSDRQGGLDEAVSKVFEDSNHGYCLSHLIEKFKSELQQSWTEELKTVLVDYLKSAACAYREVDFNKYIDNIRKVSDDLADWILSTKPEIWSNAFFKGLHYDVMAIDAAESFNTWITEVARKEATVVQIVDFIRCKLMDTIYTRRESANKWTEILTPSMRQKLEQESSKASSLQVTSSVSSVFEVNDDIIYTVNVETGECTCRKWQATGLPCVHAVAVINHMDGCVYDYCLKYLKTEFYRLTYSVSINPIPDGGGNGDTVLALASYSPRIGRLPGRPKEKPMELQKMSKRSVQCSRCHEFGHNRLTCKAPV